MKSQIIGLGQKMLSDTDFIKYEQQYKAKNTIDIGLLMTLLDKYKDLYSVFLKINILIYGYSTKELDDELRDYLHYKGNNYYVDDLDIILRHYYKNYDRCRKALKMIVTCGLRPLKEINLLKEIINRPIEKEIMAIWNDEVLSVE